MQRLLRVIGALLVAPILVSCGDSPLQPKDVLRTEVSLEPTLVAPGDTLRATVRVTNTSDRRIVLDGPDSCLFVARATKGERDVPLEGTSWGCLTVPTDHEFLPRETVEERFRFRAIRRDVGTDTLPEAGEYTLLVEFHVPIPKIRHRFRIIR